MEILGGIEDNRKICGSARVSQLHISANEVQPNLFCGCFNGSDSENRLYNSPQSVPGCIHQGFIRLISQAIVLIDGLYRH